MNKFYMFDINLQCIIQHKEGHICPKDMQSSYNLFFVFVNCLSGGRSWSFYLYIRRLTK